MIKKTLVIGASEKPERYSNKAIKALKQNGHPVVAIAPRKGEVDGVSFETEKKTFQDIDTVTLYVGPRIQPEYYDYILKLNPKRVIFNPGTENAEFYTKLKSQDIQAVEACTLVLLSIGAY